MLPSVELIDLTGLSSDDEHEDNAAGEEDGEWEDIIDLTNLSSDDEDEDVVELAIPQQRKKEKRRDQTCELCNRVARYDRGVTKHHLYPQSVTKAASAGAYTPEQRNATANLCWPCHCAIHRIMTNETLAASFHSVEKLKADDEVQSWIRKMQRATTADLDAPSQRSKAIRVATRASKRKTRFLLEPLGGQRPLPSQRPVEDMSRFVEVRRSTRLAERGTGASSTIARVGAFSASSACGVMKIGMSKKAKKRAMKREQAARLPQINQALDVLWEHNGNTFPRNLPGKNRKNRMLRDTIRHLCNNRDVRAVDVKTALRSRPEYRGWYDWAYYTNLEKPGDIERLPQVLGDLGIGMNQSPGVPEGDGGTTAMEGVEIQNIENGDGQVMEGVETQNIENGDGHAPDVEDQGSLAALEKSGDYIPL